MAPELRKRTNSKAAVEKPVQKRKALEQSSPVASKKAKPAKPEKKSKKSEDPVETDSKPKKPLKGSKASKDVPAPAAEETEQPVSDHDAEDGGDDQALILAEAVDKDADDGIVDASATFKEGQDVGKAPKAAKSSKRASQAGGGEEAGVVYIGRIPHGFYEHEMRAYFSQFGTISKLRLARNKKTAASRHFAFIEFEEASTAEIVAKTMNNYLLFGHLLKCSVVPQSQIHPDLWKGANRRFKKVPWNKMAGGELKKPRTESTWATKISREEKKREEKAKKLLELGYEFENPKLKATEDVPIRPAGLIGDEKAETPKAIEGAKTDGEEGAADESLAEQLEVEADKKEDEAAAKDTAVSKKKAAPKANKKASKGSKAKAKA